MSLILSTHSNMASKGVHPKSNFAPFTSSLITCCSNVVHSFSIFFSLISSVFRPCYGDDRDRRDHAHRHKHRHSHGGAPRGSEVNQPPNQPRYPPESPAASPASPQQQVNTDTHSSLPYSSIAIEVKKTGMLKKGKQSGMKKVMFFSMCTEPTTTKQAVLKK